MRNIAIFGGAFDPPHIGHLSNISAVLNSALVDEVWLVPSGDIRDKPSTAKAAHRVKMLELFLQENFKDDSAVRLDISQIRDNAPGSFTIDLMTYFRRSHAKDNFFFIIGTELVKDLPQWKETERLKVEVQFLVVPRPGYSFDAQSEYNLTLLPESFLLSSSASSTAIRRLLREKKRTAGFLSPAVLSYVKANQLYV